MKPLTPLLLCFAATLSLPACQAEIGDECAYDADCSPNMDRNCDRSQPGGYCLIIGCEQGGCPGESWCVEFTTPCPKDENGETAKPEICRQMEPNRVRSYCLRKCSEGCRGGYECQEPPYGVFLDDVKDGAEVCLPKEPVSTDTAAKDGE